VDNSSQKEVTIMHFDVDNLSSRRKTFSPFEISSIIFSLYSKMINFFIEKNSLSFFMGGDNFMVVASINGKIKTMTRELMQKYNLALMVTPNQDILFLNIPESAKNDFETDLKSYGYGVRNGSPYSQLRTLSGACVGRDTCRLTYTDSEKFEPELLDELESLGWGDLKESIGITGCERQCFRPATKSIGLVGSGLNRYQFKLFGDVTGRFQGYPLISEDGKDICLTPRVIECAAKTCIVDSSGLG